MRPFMCPPVAGRGIFVLDNVYKMAIFGHENKKTPYIWVSLH